MFKTCKPPADRRREDIALIALGLFREKGFSGTSMNAVARAAGIRKPSLYHHFASKEELFIAALTADIAAPLASVAALLEDPSGDAGDRFRRALGLLYDAMVGSSVGNLAAVIAETAQQVPAVAEGFHDEFITLFEDALERAYRPCVAAGTHRGLPREEIGQVVFGPLLSISMSKAMFREVPRIATGWEKGKSRPEFVAMIDGLLRV